MHPSIPHPVNGSSYVRGIMARKPTPAANRLPEFRAWAREITQENKEARKYGASTDLNGQLARALERAYQKGFEEAQTGQDSLSVSTDADPNNPKPLARSVVTVKISSALHVLGLRRFGSKTTYNPERNEAVAFIQDDYISNLTTRDPDWRIITQHGFEKESFSNRTIQQLVKLGLLVPASSNHEALQGRRLLRLSPKGKATYRSLYIEQR